MTEESATVSHIGDLIIPPADPLGALQASVPAYIDYLDSNEQWRRLDRDGIPQLLLPLNRQVQRKFLLGSYLDAENWTR